MKTFRLIWKSFFGLLFLLAIISASLFLSHGRLHYPLAWLYLGVFTVSVVFITGYLLLFDKHLLESRLAAGPVAEKRTTQKMIQSVASLAFLSIFILSGLDQRNKWSNVPLVLSYVGDVFCALSFVLLFFVFKQNTFLSATIEVQERQQVISTGLYGFVRHPMYTGALFLLLFTPISLGSFWALLSVAIIAVVIIYRAADEEQELKINLVGYKEYCERVKYRLIPFVY